MTFKYLLPPSGQRTDILTVTGRYFDFTNPAGSEFSIIDIAHALSNICRFTGHTRSFYSVAQHSVLVSHLVPAHMAFMGLMHDAAEAFVGDMSRPLKQLLPQYKEIELRVERAIFDRFDLPHELPPEIKHADNVALATEKRDLMLVTRDEWHVLRGVQPSAHRIWAKQPTDAKMMFLHRVRELRPDLIMEGLL